MSLQFVCSAEIHFRPFDDDVFFLVKLGTMVTFDEDEDLNISGGEFTSGSKISGVHGKARHFFTFTCYLISISVVVFF